MLVPQDLELVNYISNLIGSVISDSLDNKKSIRKYRSILGTR